MRPRLDLNILHRVFHYCCLCALCGLEGARALGLLLRLMQLGLRLGDDGCRQASPLGRLDGRLQPGGVCGHQRQRHGRPQPSFHLSALANLCIFRVLHFFQPRSHLCFCGEHRVGLLRRKLSLFGFRLESGLGPCLGLGLYLGRRRGLRRSLRLFALLLLGRFRGLAHSFRELRFSRGHRLRCHACLLCRLDRRAQLGGVGRLQPEGHGSAQTRLRLLLRLLSRGGSWLRSRRPERRVLGILLHIRGCDRWHRRWRARSHWPGLSLRLVESWDRADACRHDAQVAHLLRGGQPEGRRPCRLHDSRARPERGGVVRHTHGGKREHAEDSGVDDEGLEIGAGRRRVEAVRVEEIMPQRRAGGVHGRERGAHRCDLAQHTRAVRSRQRTA